MVAADSGSRMRHGISLCNWILEASGRSVSDYDSGTDHRAIDDSGADYHLGASREAKRNRVGADLCARFSGAVAMERHCLAGNLAADHWVCLDCY